MRAALLSFVVIVGSVACSATASRSTFTSASSTGTNTGSGSTSNGSGGATAGSTSTGSGQGGGIGLGGSFATGVGGGASSNCSSASELVYVFSAEGDIYSFDPPNKKFTKFATPDCNASGAANSMAIDRNLVAWINYIGGIYTFDLNTKTGCTQAVSLPKAYKQVGMGFSADSTGSNSETLFIDGIGQGGLATVVNSSVMMVGDFSGDNALTGESCELTGTGDAKLYGYFTTSPNVRVAEINKTNGAILSDYELKGVAPPDDWAFSFWGGDFYLYAATGSDNSTVIHYTPGATPTVDTNYIADVGFQIVGAGVSTCAPISPPQ